MFDIDPNTPGLAEAADKLNALMAQEASASPSQPESATPAPEIPAAAEQRAAPAESATDPAAVPSVPTVPPATAEAPATSTEPTKDASPAPTPEPQTPTEPDKRSRYEKEAERLPRSWKEFNERKAAVKAQQEAAEKALAERQAEIERREAEIEEPGPERFLAFAGQKRAEAAALAKQAEAAEEAGKFDEAKRLERQAQRLTDKAEEAEAAAQDAQQRGPSQRQQQLEAQRKEWGIKAGIDFPDLLKRNSPLNAKVNELLEAEPKLRKEPSGTYWAARLASAELGAAAVPGLRSELEKTRARVRELEAATSPGASGVPQAVRSPGSFNEMNPAQQEEFLMRQARDIGHL